MANAAKRPAAVVMIRPVLKIAGGHITVAHLNARGEEENIARLTVGGDPDHDWPGLFDCVGRELKAGCRRFILDLDRVPWMNSRGLGRLIELWQLVEKGGGVIAVICTSDRIRNILAISQIDQILVPRASLAEALEVVGES